MWKPDESLDDYIGRTTDEVDSEAPRPVSLRRTGEVEVLKPLTLVEIRARRSRYAFRAAHQPLWFRHFLAAGSGALVMIAFALVSAILIGINDRSGGTEVATNETQTDAAITLPDEPFSLGFSSFASENGEADPVRSNTRRRPRPTIHLAASKPKRQLRPRLKLAKPHFVPTTLVIYAKNGVINTRVEPWLQARTGF
ncbi:MAG TPA: hypothetical protein VMZ26_14300 [Pyrinomonadaceae bacterium]|nr:hypothetical protein [Pyrinomonadaceae bacterium]